MSVFKKLKDVLFDIEEEDIPVISKEEPVKEVNPIKEIKMPVEEPTPVEEPVKESKFNFPLDDFEDDFELPTRTKKDSFYEEEYAKPREGIKKEEPIKRKEDNYRYQPREINLTPRKEENKPFRPSPVISPVYGILDQNYTKDDIIVKNDTKEKPNLDDIRAKVYAKKKETPKEKPRTIDDILKNEEEIEKPKIKEEIFEEPIIMDAPVEETVSNPIIDEPLIQDEPLIVDEPLVDLYDDEEEPVREEDLEKTLENDLFDLIDSMYENREETEEEE